MKTIANKDLKSQIRERASLFINKTGGCEPNERFFVQIDDWYAVADDGCIYQIISKSDLEGDLDFKPLLVYFAEDSDNAYNYAEDSADFDPESEDAEIFDHCREQAELLAMNYTNY